MGYHLDRSLARLWNATHVGQRTRRDALLHLRRVRDQVLHASPPPLISTDGFQWYEKIIPRLFGPTCVYVMVEKKYGKGRIRRSRTRLIMGTQDELDLAFQRSEDSRKINTSYGRVMVLPTRNRRRESGLTTLNGGPDGGESFLASDPNDSATS